VGDSSRADDRFDHRFAEANGITIHYVRAGQGLPLVLLHGWPEFWRTWHRVIPTLAREFDVIAPDLRGFGRTDKPDLPATEGYTIGDHVGDLLGLADALGIERFGLVSHDVGSYISQAFARAHPDRLIGLFFFDCPYPGIGRRWIEPDQISEIWYQTFNQQPWAADLVGSSREACGIYFRHFFRHWAHLPDAFDDDEIEIWVDNFMAPGNLQGGFNWYIAVGQARRELMRHGAPTLPGITVPTCVRWGAADPILRAEWMDLLGDYFSDCDASTLEGVGHYAAMERPDIATMEIAEFFRGRSVD
jgi:pimeloyl-ACP methyl ester carboxylesterase